MSPNLERNWIDSIRSAYTSGAFNQFVLHGNIQDGFVSGAQLVGIADYLCQDLLQRFDVVLGYSLDRGIQPLRLPSGAPKDFMPGISRQDDGSYRPSLRDPASAFDWLGRKLLEIVNLGRTTTSRWHTAVIIENAHLIAPASAAQTLNHELAALALTLRNWSHTTALREHPLAIFLLTENLGELHPTLARNPRAMLVNVPLPNRENLEKSLTILANLYPVGLDKQNVAPMAEQLVGASLTAIESRVKLAAQSSSPLALEEVAGIKKELVERDAQNLFDFIPPRRSFRDLAGNQLIKEWLSRDLALWQQNKIAGVPMGYLLAGPIGTGKTYLVECLGGEARVPIVRLKNFRERWVGATEGNLEKIFTLLHALGRVIVFIDEADQALGKRTAGDGDSGLSGRIYGMVAEEMSRSENRGRIVWILASSRPDLIEVDLKRPGRVDVKIPLLPTVDRIESFALLRALLARKGFDLPKEEKWIEENTALSQEHITAGAAEALAAKLYREVYARGRKLVDVMPMVLRDYQPPVPYGIIEQQIRLAVNEATDLDLIPPSFRKYRD